MMRYLEAHPGIRQVIDRKIFTIKRMYSSRDDALKCVDGYRANGGYTAVRLYLRKKEGRPFGKHPWCVAVRGRR